MTACHTLQFWPARHLAVDSMQLAVCYCRWWARGRRVTLSADGYDLSSTATSVVDLAVLWALVTAVSGKALVLPAPGFHRQCHPLHP